MEMSRKLIRIFALAIIILCLFLSFSSTKSMAGNSFLNTFFDQLSLKVNSSSIKIDSSKKIVTITKHQNDTSHLKINTNPNDWTVNLKNFKWLYFNPSNKKYDLTIKNSSATIRISGNTFSGTDNDISVNLRNTSKTSYYVKEIKTESDPSKRIIKNESYIITGKKTVSLYKSASKSNRVTIPSQIQIGNESYKVTGISPNAFKNNKNIKEIRLPETLTTIGDQSFYGCKNLKTIKINIASLKAIEKQAFEGIKNNARFSITARNKRSYNSCINLIKKTAPKSNFSYIMIKEDAKAAE